MPRLQVVLQLVLLLPATAIAAPTAPTSPPPPERESIARFTLGEEMILQAPVLVATRVESTSRYAVDHQRTMFESGAVDTVFRLGLKFDSKLEWVPFLVLAEYEHDLFTGTNSGLPRLEGDGFPAQNPSTDELRKLYLRVSLGWYVHAGFGFNVSHWGLGLVANDGAHGYSPGGALFVDPRGGDRVLRGFLASGPHTDLKLFASVAIDEVQDDDASLPGDSSRQFVAAFIAGRGLPNSAGIYLVQRKQTAASGGEIDVFVADVTAKVSGEIEDLGHWALEGEVAHVFGETTVAGTPDFPVQDVSQLGLALRASLDAGVLGGVLDFLYASGDQNFDDASQNAFKVDPNYPLGLLLHRHLMAAETARAVHVAANPDLSGYPARGLERFPTRGSASNTIAVFPRIFWRPMVELEVYGGPLFAWSAATMIDPLHTKLAGGSPRNAFDRAPGNYLGTELDLGLRWMDDLFGTKLELGAEIAVLIPGSAFAGGTQRVHGGRAFVAYRL